MIVGNFFCFLTLSTNLLHELDTYFCWWHMKVANRLAVNQTLLTAATRFWCQRLQVSQKHQKFLDSTEVQHIFEYQVNNEIPTYLFTYFWATVSKLVKWSAKYWLAVQIRAATWHIDLHIEVFLGNTLNSLTELSQFCHHNLTSVSKEITLEMEMKSNFFKPLDGGSLLWQPAGWRIEVGHLIPKASPMLTATFSGHHLIHKLATAAPRTQRQQKSSFAA